MNIYAGALAALLCLSAPARAQEEEPTIFAGAGPGFAPEYEGADEYTPIPFLVGQIRWGARRFVGTDGTGLRADLVGWRFIEAGPAVGYRFARNADAEDAAIAQLAPVDAAVEVGGFLAFNFPFPLGDNPRDALTLDGSYLSDVAGGHGGQTARLSVLYRGQLGERLFLQAGPFVDWGSDDFMAAYYSIAPEAAARLGVAAFTAESGVRAYGLRVSGRYMVTERWGLTASLTTRRLAGDAADSPIIETFGAPTTFQGGIALTRMF